MCLGKYARAHVYTLKDTLVPPTLCFTIAAQEGFTNPVRAGCEFPGAGDNGVLVGSAAELHGKKSGSVSSRNSISGYE